ncbi:MAG: ComF family protein [Proteobacteria bacterium]|nr:ComF family protein [Pseudomonadota bacterium]
MIGRGLWQAAAHRAGRALDLVLPPQCLKCGAIVEEPGSLCADCWRGLSFIAPPLCAACGVPFAFEVGEGALCGACVARPPAYRRARSVMVYDQGSKGLVLAFKHADRTDAAPAFARWMMRAGESLLAGAELVVPVPLHRWRLLGRRYNQAALLAMALARLALRPCLPDLLLRRRATPALGGLGRDERRRALAGAFALNPRHRRPGREAAWRGRTLLLVDDVLTTGATVEACAEVLLAAGVEAVDVLTLQRVVAPGG